MLNDNLPRSELESSLEEYWDSINFILHEIAPNENISLESKAVMGKLHHALNISSYKQPKFRAQLLKHADPKTCSRFFKRIGVATIPHDDKQYTALIEKSSKIPWGNNEETRAFIEEFGYDESMMPVQIQDNESTFTIQSKSPLKTLKEYQSEVFYEAMQLIENPWMRFIIKMPTGAGKTRTALEMVCGFLNNGIENKEKRQVVWLADREELCEQAIASMHEHMITTPS